MGKKIKLGTIIFMSDAFLAREDTLTRGVFLLAFYSVINVRHLISPC